jgi:type I restriction enzyme R subunit
VILTTSQLLTTGVDAPMVKNVALVRTVNSMVEFKQIIGRGTRIRDDYGKYFFTILDYTGSATRHFADPDFDGQPAFVTEERTDAAGAVVASKTEAVAPLGDPDGAGEVVVEEPAPIITDRLREAEGRKYYVDGGAVKVVADLVYELDPDGRQLRVVRITDYARDKVRELFPSAADLRAKWSHADERQAVLDKLAERGIDLDRLREATRQPDADVLDLLCHVVFSSPLRSRRERADRLRKEHREFFERFAPEAREILDEVLEKYAEHGVAQLTDPKILQVPPLSRHGNALEIAGRFGGPKRLRSALEDLQRLLYAA